MRVNFHASLVFCIFYAKISYMKKKVQLTLEFLAKCKSTSREHQKIYDVLLCELSEENLCSKSMFSCKRIKELLDGEITTQEVAEKFLQKHLIPKHEEFEAFLQKIFISLLSSNFPTHAPLLKIGINEFEAGLSKVEAKIYMMIKTYIKTLLMALELFVFFDEKRERELSQVVEFAKKSHRAIMENLFYEEEESLMDESLKQLLTVYVGIYFNFCYEQEA